MRIRIAEAAMGTLLAGALLVTTGVARAPAQGFGVYEQGTCAMGRAGAAVADPCEDGSAIFFNPAALIGRPGATELTAGATAIFPDGGFTADDGARFDLDADVVMVPHLYAARTLSSRAAIGIGLFAPYGLSTRWSTDFEGRYLGYDNSLRSIYVQPTAAWRFGERISVGGGPTIVVGSVEVNRRLDLAAVPVPGAPAGTTFADLGIPAGTDFADHGLDAGGAVGVGGHVGVLIDLGDRVRLGSRYMSPVELDYEGDATFAQIETGIPLPADNPFGVPAGTPIDQVLAPRFEAGGPFSDGGVSTTIEMPAQWVTGVTVEATSRLKLHGDVQWTGWSAFDEVVIDFDEPATPDETLPEDYDDTITTRLGAEVRVEPVILRGGWIWNEAAAPDESVTPLLPEAERNQFTVGVSWPLGAGWTLDGAYQYLLQQDRRGRSLPVPPGTPAVAVPSSGEYAFDSHLVGLTVRRIF